ncbi:hypothetical protein S40288_08332 [Stachybotrys chartarum IBT 40288]|nr:hypothetical protein S40288_08332 [Stachybotrys chartarum IBT 40288]
MSAVKFQCPSYKLFEPDCHPQGPIIVGVDDRLESPETITLRYEEAARAANGGDPSRDSPPRLLDMAAYSKAQLPSMHGYDTTRYQDSSYDQYSSHGFPDQQTEKFAQLNQQSFNSNNAVPSYIPAGPTVLSCLPASGITGTKVFLKISSQYDLFSMSSMPYFSLLFGSEKVLMQDVAKESQDNTGVIYSCSADAPQGLVTGCSGSNVPLSLVIEGPSGEEISRTVAGTFQYLDGPADDITRTDKVKHDTAPPADTSPRGDGAALSTDATTNTCDYPAPQGQYAAAFPQTNTDMIAAYRSASFQEPHYRRRSAHGWSPYPTTLGSTGRSPGLDHIGLGGRPSLTSLPMPSSSGNNPPQLIRTSTITNGASSAGAYHPISIYSSKAVLRINGKLETMAKEWTQEEWDNRRRLVMFRKSQTGSTLTANFRAVSVNERPPNSICISCIWWAEKGQCYVTSVDTIHLLEQLVAAPNRFTVEEKNRIRRNLEGFHPVTVSKGKRESEEFFKIIMAFPTPKPRNIEKDVKVFPWSILEQALKKIIGKYSASPSSNLPPTSLMSHGGAGGAGGAPYAPLPTPPGLGLASQQSLPSHAGDAHTQYGGQSNHHDTIPSPRSLSGSQSTWAPYTTCAPGYSSASTRTLSPSIRHNSPQHHTSTMRLNTTALPAVTSYDTRTVTTGGYGGTGLHTPISHHPSTATPPRWDPAPASAYSDGYSSLSTHHSQNTQPVYSTGGYGEGAPRA